MLTVTKKNPEARMFGAATGCCLSLWALLIGAGVGGTGMPPRIELFDVRYV